jgi:hypothetical protein
MALLSIKPSALKESSENSSISAGGHRPQTYCSERGRNCGAVSASNVPRG